MSSCFHSRQNIIDGDGIHSPVSYIYANAAARLAATGFVQSDGYKLAVDDDTKLIFMLADWTGPTWVAMGAGGGSDTTAIHDNVAGEIAAITLKGTPTTSDLLLIEDDADSDNKKRITIGSMPFTPSSHASDTNNPHNTDIGNLGSGTLAALNSIITDATLDTNTASRPPNGSASGELSGTYPSPTIASGVIDDDNINASADIAVSKLAAGDDGYVLTVSGSTPTWLPNDGVVDNDAIHDNVSGEIAAITLKSTPVGADILLIEDSADSNNKKRITISGIVSSKWRFPFPAHNLRSTFNGDWAVNVNAPVSVDTNDGDNLVRRFDDTNEEGCGFGFTLPSDTSSISLRIRSRAETAPGSAETVRLGIYTKTYADNTAPGSWSSVNLLTAINIPTNENYQEDSESFTYATLGLTAGDYVKFQLTRVPSDGSDTLSTDWTLLELDVELS